MTNSQAIDIIIKTIPPRIIRKITVIDLLLINDHQKYNETLHLIDEQYSALNKWAELLQ